MTEKSWQTYEEVSAYLLDLFKIEFGLERVEGKQKINGEVSSWEIDVKGVRKDGEEIIVGECRRYTTSKINQNDLAALSYIIKDLGATGGIIVSPLGLQKGANKIAEHEGIISVTLTPESTPNDFNIGFFEKLKGGRGLTAEICGVKPNSTNNDE